MFSTVFAFLLVDHLELVLLKVAQTPNKFAPLGSGWGLIHIPLSRPRSGMSAALTVFFDLTSVSSVSDEKMIITPSLHNILQEHSKRIVVDVVRITVQRRTDAHYSEVLEPKP